MTKKKQRTILRGLHRKADKALSEYVREQTRWAYTKCPLCLTKPIQCCFHFVTRRKKILRWELANVVGACFTCNYIEQHFPDLSRAWYIRTYGAPAYLALVDQALKPFEPTEEYLRGIIDKYKLQLQALLGKKASATNTQKKGKQNAANPDTNRP